jgi:hypothetical protein
MKLVAITAALIGAASLFSVSASAQQTEQLQAPPSMRPAANAIPQPQRQRPQQTGTATSEPASASANMTVVPAQRTDPAR